ncbi:MAG: hypothetical protein HZC50_04900 [Nitrospirae bacterium]|nr:hypothetical protein [Nitrospirota bacterium]
MPSVRLVTEEASTLVTSAPTAPSRVWRYIAISAVLLGIIGTWLVWFSVFIQRNLQEDDVRAACRRAMPDTADRCFDTVVIQRGGVRR